MRKLSSAALLAALLLGGCVVAPGPVYEVAPALPGVVILDVEPYYSQGGFYYYYHDNRWSYSRQRVGPWRDLPRDRYPGEVRFRGRDRDRDHDGDRDRDREGPGRGY